VHTAVANAARKAAADKVAALKNAVAKKAAAIKKTVQDIKKVGQDAKQAFSKTVSSNKSAGTSPAHPPPPPTATHEVKHPESHPAAAAAAHGKEEQHDASHHATPHPAPTNTLAKEDHGKQKQDTHHSTVAGKTTATSNDTIKTHSHDDHSKEHATATNNKQPHDDHGKQQGRTSTTNTNKTHDDHGKQQVAAADNKGKSPAVQKNAHEDFSFSWSIPMQHTIHLFDGLADKIDKSERDKMKGEIQSIINELKKFMNVSKDQDELFQKLEGGDFESHIDKILENMQKRHPNELSLVLHDAVMADVVQEIEHHYKKSGSKQ
jgi:hypothetical protein